MTWHDYAATGIAPTFWFLVLVVPCLYLTGVAVRDRRRSGRGFGGVIVGSTIFSLIVTLMCLGTLVDRLDQRQLLASAASAGSSFGGSSGLSSGSSSGTTSLPGLRPTARCSDGTSSFSAHHQGTCSHHGGVAQWMDLPAPALVPPTEQEPWSSPVPPAPVSATPESSPTPETPAAAAPSVVSSPKASPWPSLSPSWTAPAMSANNVDCSGQKDTCTWSAAVFPGSRPVSLQASDFTLHMHNAARDYTGRVSSDGPGHCQAPAGGGTEHPCDLIVGFDIPAGEQIDGQTLHVVVNGVALHASS